MQNLPLTTSTQITHAVLIKLTVNTSTYTISNAYSPLTWDGTVYLGMGHFLAMNEIQDELQVTNNQIQITLSGIPKDVGEQGLGIYNSYVSLILDQRIKGSSVEIWRAIFDPQTGAIDNSSTSLRFKGYISNFTISDNTDIESKTDSYTVAVTCSSVLGILERKITGRRTNATDQRALYPTDSGMDRVTAISNTAFDFGRPFSRGTGGGYDGGGGPGSFDDFFNQQQR
jgi:hypothetical protein